MKKNKMEQREFRRNILKLLSLFAIEANEMHRLVLDSLRAHVATLIRSGRRGAYTKRARRDLRIVSQALQDSSSLYEHLDLPLRVADREARRKCLQIALGNWNTTGGG